MRILIACDSFKDTLSSPGVCAAIARGLRRGGKRGIRIKEMPLSDGGEGVLETLRDALSLTPVSLVVADPLFRPVRASYGISADGVTALVEMAQASGLQRLAANERDPLLTTTYGTGELLADARKRGVRKVLLALGGSATNDAGIGAASALGWRFLDSNGADVRAVGGALQDIVRIEAPASLPFEQVQVLCDVTNPLFGPEGAAFIYGRQKGGTDESLARLDRGLRHIALLVEQQLNREGLASSPGAGAAGGFGFGALAFLGAKLTRGIEVVLDLVSFEVAARNTDLIITGEGRIDAQSAQGKLIQGVCRRAGKTPVIALCGALSATPEQVKAIGLKAAYAINPPGKGLAEMLPRTAENLEKTAATLLEKLDG